MRKRHQLLALAFALQVSGLALAQTEPGSAIPAPSSGAPNTGNVSSTPAVLPPSADPGSTSPTKSTSPLTVNVEGQQVALPEGTMEAVTLRAHLQKSQELPLTLENALRLAMGQNIVIDLADENVQVRRWERMLSLATLLPDVTFQYNQSRFRGAVQIFGGGTVAIIRPTVQPQVTFNYTISTGGRDIFLLRASQQREAAQKSLAEETRQDILRQVALAYYDLQQAYWLRAIALQSIEEAQQQVDLNQARLTSGVGVRLELLQSQTTLATRRNDLITTENSISTASNRLSQLLNMDFDVDIVPNALEATVHPLVDETISIDTLLATAYANNPRIKALQNLIEAGRSDVRAAIASIFPVVQITAFANGTGPDWASLQFSRFTGIQASTSLLQGMGVAPFAGVQLARTNERIAKLNLADFDNTLRENIANAVVSLRTFEARIAASREALSFARSAYEQALGRLREGVGTNTDVIAANTTLIRARADLANAFLDYNKAAVNLVFVLGVASVETLTQGYTFSPAPAAQVSPNLGAALAKSRLKP